MRSIIDSNLQKKIIYLQTNDGLEFAYANMAQNEIKNCLVLNAQKEIVGIISDAAINRSLKSGPQNSVKNSNKIGYSNFHYDPNEKVSDYMCTKFIIVNDYENLEEFFSSIKDTSTCIILKVNSTVRGFMTCKDVLKVVEACRFQPQAL